MRCLKVACCQTWPFSASSSWCPNAQQHTGAHYEYSTNVACLLSQSHFTPCISNPDLYEAALPQSWSFLPAVGFLQLLNFFWSVVAELIEAVVISESVWTPSPVSRRDLNLNQSFSSVSKCWNLAQVHRRRAGGGLADGSLCAALRGALVQRQWRHVAVVYILCVWWEQVLGRRRLFPKTDLLLLRLIYHIFLQESLMQVLAGHCGRDRKYAASHQRKRKHGHKSF